MPSKTPAQTNCVRRSHSGSADHSGAPPSFASLLLLLFWTVHGPFSRFLLEENEKMGGALHQPSLVAKLPRPQGRVQAPNFIPFIAFPLKICYNSNGKNFR